MIHRSRIFRNSTDDDVRRLSREAVHGDRAALLRLFGLLARSPDSDELVLPILAAGWEVANDMFAPMDLGSPRDDMILALGRGLVRLGWLPDLPLPPGSYLAGHSHKPGLQIRDRYGQRSLQRKEPPVRLSGDFGRAKTWHFEATTGFSGYDLMNSRFFFNVSPVGRNYRAGALGGVIERLLEGKQLRKVAPRTWFLSRWDQAQPTTTSALTPLYAGVGWHYVSNTISVYEMSEGEGVAPWLRPEERTDARRRSAREAFVQEARRLPGEETPPPGTPVHDVRLWLMNPERIEAIRALFYGDLFVGGFMIGPNEVRYDPVTRRPFD